MNIKKQQIVLDMGSPVIRLKRPHLVIQYAIGKVIEVNEPDQSKNLKNDRLPQDIPKFLLNSMGIRYYVTMTNNH